MPHFLRLVLLALTPVVFAASLDAAAFYVSPAGSDSAAGTIGAPFATIARARDAARALRAAGGLPAGGINVWLRAGTYELSSPLLLDERDSGDANHPVVYAAWAGEDVHLSGGKTLPANWFAPVTSAAAAWTRLDAAARGQVYAVDLRAHGITDYGTLQAHGFNFANPAALEVFLGARPLTLARWPNADAALARTVAATSPTSFTYAGTRPERWGNAQGMWLEGFWASTWADFHVAATGLNTGSKTISLAATSSMGLEADRPYFVYNLLEELDQPGEYYLDRSTGILYVWPTAPLGTQPIQISGLEATLVQLAGTTNVSFRDLILEVTRGPLVGITGGSDNRFERCLLRDAGQYAGRVSGLRNGFDQCEIYDCGDDGVLVSGGDRASLTPGANFVTNSRIERTGRISLTYHPGINLLGGCGNLAAHNLLGDMPHAAIIFSGNLHRMEYNEIREVCKMTSDAGAIYSGRDWSYRGNTIEFNFIHHLASVQPGNGVHGVYLDDLMSGALVRGNVFYQIAGAGIFCGGGRDNLMRNNLFAACEIAHYNGDYAREQVSNAAGSTWNLLERLTLDGIKYQQNPWASAFPALAAVPFSWSAIQGGLWRNPQNCVFADNAGWANGSWMVETNFSGTGIFSVYASITNNQPAQAPLFDDNAAFDRAQRGTLQASIANFAAIPFAQIGPDATGIVVTSAPAAPTLGNSAPTASEVGLRWSSSGNPPSRRESGIAIEQRSGTQGAWSVVRSLAANADSAVITGLASSAVYTFRVREFNSAGATYSNELVVVTADAPLVAGLAVRTEAEDAYAVLADTGGNGAVGVSNATSDSGQSIRLFDPGDAVRVSFPVPSAGLYRIGVRLRSGDASIPVGSDYWPNGYRFKLDGNALILTGDPATISALDNSYGPAYWGTMYSDAVTLTAGSHTIDVTAVTPWGVLDYVEIAPLAGGPIGPIVPPAPPPPPAPTVPSARSARIEVEDDYIVTNDVGGNGAVAAQVSQLNSGKSVSLFDVGDALKLAFSVDATGDYTLAVRVRAGDASSTTAYWPGGYQFKLDGIVLTPQGDATTLSALDTVFGPTYWGTMTAQAANLPGGTHTLEVAAVRAWGALDYLEVAPGAPVVVLAPNETVRIEAEDQMVILSDAGPNGAIRSNDAILDSGQSVALFDPGDAVRLAFVVNAAGPVRLGVRVRAGDALDATSYWPGGYEFRLDGQPVGFSGDGATLSTLENSYGPTIWGTMYASIASLGSGTHYLDIAASRAWAVLDYLEVSPSVAPAIRLEVEAPLAVLADTGDNGPVVAHDAYLDSDLSVPLFDVGDAVQVSFTVNVAGEFRLAARVRAGDAAGLTSFWPDGYRFTLDGQPITLAGDASTLSALDPAYGPTYWGTMTGSTGWLNYGTHVLEIAATRAWAIADYVELSAP